MIQEVFDAAAAALVSEGMKKEIFKRTYFWEEALRSGVDRVICRWENDSKNGLYCGMEGCNWNSSIV